MFTYLVFSCGVLLCIVYAYILVDLVRDVWRNNLRLVVFDMNRTLLRIHTGGIYEKSMCELARFVSPTFKRVVPQLIAQGIHVGVATSIYTFSYRVYLHF
jgi:hypothetical protein